MMSRRDMIGFDLLGGDRRAGITCLSHDTRFAGSSGFWRFFATTPPVALP
jgi:hypothetical protein